MKQKIAPVLAFLILVSSLTSSSLPVNATSNDVTANNTVSSAEVSTVVPVSGDAFVDTSTGDLILAILNSKTVISLFASNSTETTGYQMILDQDPALQELERREDASDVLATLLVDRMDRIQSGAANLADLSLAMLIMEPIYAQALSEESIAMIADAAQITSDATRSTTMSSNSRQVGLWDMVVYYFLSATATYTQTTLSTKDGTEVIAYTASHDLPVGTKQAYQESVLEAYPNVTALELPSLVYNCHSYAWHMSSSSNTYWINDIEPYIYDAHTLPRGTPAVGNICVYYDSHYEPVHSAIISSVENGTVKCISKWGSLGVYEHERDDVPDAYKMGTPDEIYCMYFDYRNHNYEISLITAASHCYTCTVCLENDYEDHIYSVNEYNNEAHIQQCEICAYNYSENHDVHMTGYNASGHVMKCSECNYSYITSHTTNALGVCKVCGYSGPSVMDSLPGDKAEPCCAHG